MKPECRFCDCSAADWKHLFFVCPKYKSRRTLFDKLCVDHLRTKTADKIIEKFETGDLDGLLDILLLLDDSTHYLNDIRILCTAISHILVRVEHDWAQAAEDVVG